MKLIENLKSYVCSVRDKRKAKKYDERVEKAETVFNVICRDNVNYITHNDVIVSRATDTDILERLNELREMYKKGDVYNN